MITTCMEQNILLALPLRTSQSPCSDVQNLQVKIYTYCRQTSLFSSHSTFQTKFFHYSSEWVPSSPWLAVHLSQGSCCRTNQAVTPQGDHSLLPPAVYIPTHSAPGSGRGRKWSHAACAYVTQAWCVRNKSAGLLRIEVTRSLWSMLTKATLGLHAVLHGCTEQDYLTVAVSIQNWIKVN